jgi:hypothetical protein
LKNFNVGQWVWYWGKNSICNAQIIRTENGFCEFEGGEKVEQERCYISFEELRNDNKNRN